MQNIAKELPHPPIMSYFLCDSWYVSEKIINTVGALKTNRLLYPFGIKKKLSEFAALLSVTHLDFNLVTVKNQNYYVYRYEGKLNSIENAVVLLSYLKKHLDTRKRCGLFLALTCHYRPMKSCPVMYAGGRLKYFFDSARINWHWTVTRSILRRGICRSWLLMSLVHYIYVAGTGEACSFENGYYLICDIIQQEQFRHLC